MGLERKVYFVDTSYFTPNSKGDFARDLYEISYFTDLISPISPELIRWKEHLQNTNIFSRTHSCYTIPGVIDGIERLVDHLNQVHRWHNKDQKRIYTRKFDKGRRKDEKFERKHFERLRQEMREVGYKRGEEIEGLAILNFMIRSIRDIIKNLTIYRREWRGNHPSRAKQQNKRGRLLIDRGSIGLH